MALNFLNPPETQGNKDLYNNEINNKCSRCGGCCNAVPLPTTKHEIRMIVDFVKQYNIRRLNRSWISDFLSGNGSKEKPIGIDLSCCFYDREKKQCTIYPVRPAICKEFKCSNDVVRREEIKSRLHKIADYNYSSSPTEMPAKITNFDLLIYGDIIPLQIYFMYFTGITPKQFGELFAQYGYHGSYDLSNLK